jgi:protein-tyrosine kinase
MSKIYEALRRAEQERAATKIEEKPLPKDAQVTTTAAPLAEVWPQSDVASLPEQPAPVHQPIPAMEPPAPIRAAEPFAPFPAIEPLAPLRAAEPFAPIPPLESYKPSVAAAPAVNVSSLPMHTWTPSFHHLPALEARGRAVEQFRSLRSRMQEFRDLNTLKSILVSSGLPQEGKTFVAANLAISFARHKASRVLLIDGDMRRSSLHHLLGCTGEPGLTDYLAGNATIQDILQRPNPTESGLLQHGLDSITFIGAGKDSDKAADLSGNHRFGELIAAVSPLFDWIVIDSSPVNLVADAVNLSRACDGVLLVARAGVTKFEVAQRSLVELKASTILGFVLNAVVKPSSSGGYYGYDSYDSYDSVEQ